ncbi:MAG: UDP-glucose/GDP-mannose dehydrogenase family protein [Oligoflexia bacterium]|nr:UDP-glucose/GDP-mannose dehydrogenase family protein [Oligoflexia bacterium]
MKVVVIGTGYVGLVAGTCFAEAGNDVTCVDIDESKIARLKNGDPVIYEPGLETLIRKNIKAKRLGFTTQVKDAAGRADVIFLAVGTPTNDDGAANLSYLYKAAESVAPFMKSGSIVVNKCTAPVGTVFRIKEILSSKVGAGVNFEVASNPEFLKEGVAVQDFLYPDRVVIGVESTGAAKVLSELYKPFVRSGNPIHVMDVKSAELAKYACNCFLAVKISFINDMAFLCEKLGADISNVRTAMSTDRRIGKSFLYPGVGYGGSCFPKDVKALIKTSSEAGVELSVVRSAEKINIEQRKRFVEKIVAYFDGDVKGRVFAVWGLSFKPQTDDMREAPSITIIEELARRGAVIRATDPVAIENAGKTIRADVEYIEDYMQVLEGADALILLTEWSEYRNCEPALLNNNFKGRVVFDGRNIWEPADIVNAGYDYIGVGRNV